MMPAVLTYVARLDGISLWLISSSFGLFHHAHHGASADGVAAFADSEAQTGFNGDGGDQRRRCGRLRG